MKFTPEQIERLLSRITIVDECWLCKGAMVSQGYTEIRCHYRSFYVHRMMAMLTQGKIPNSYHVHHICGNKRCIRPSHLKVQSLKEHLQEHGKSRIEFLSPPSEPLRDCRHGHREWKWDGSQWRCKTCRNRQMIQRYHRIKSEESSIVL